MRNDKRAIEVPMTTPSPNPDDVTTRLRAAGALVKRIEMKGGVKPIADARALSSAEQAIHVAANLIASLNEEANASMVEIGLLRRQLAERDAADVLRKFAERVANMGDYLSLATEPTLEIIIAEARSALGEPQ